MSNKKKLSLFLILVLILSLSLGTFAYYSKTFTSGNNKVRAAKFEVDFKGTLDGNAEFDLTDDPIYPGVKKDIYEFKIDKKNTEVPVKYYITVTPYGELFAPVKQGNSPVEVTVLRKVGDDWVDIGGLDNVEIVPDKKIENFKIVMEWKDSDYDIKYQGKLGKVKINVVAKQVGGEVEPEDPDAPYIESISYRKTSHPNPHQYSIGTHRNLPGDHYLIYANTKDGRKVGTEYTRGAPIKGWDKWTTLKVSPEEVEDFSIIIQTKDEYGQYIEVLEMNNVPFEYNN